MAREDKTQLSRRLYDAINSIVTVPHGWESGSSDDFPEESSMGGSFMLSQWFESDAENHGNMKFVTLYLSYESDEGSFGVELSEGGAPVQTESMHNLGSACLLASQWMMEESNAKLVRKLELYNILGEDEEDVFEFDNVESEDLIDSLEDEEDDKESLIESLRDENDKLRDEISHLRTELSVMEESNRLLKERNEERKETIRERNDKVRELGQELEDKDTYQDQLQRELKTKEDKIDEMKSDIDHLEDTAERLEEKLQGKDEVIDECEERIAFLESFTSNIQEEKLQDFYEELGDMLGER